MTQRAPTDLAMIWRLYKLGWQRPGIYLLMLFFMFALSGIFALLPIILADLFQMMGLTIAGDAVADAIPQADKDEIVAKGWETVLFCLGLVPFVVAITFAACIAATTSPSLPCDCYVENI